MREAPPFGIPKVCYRTSRVTNGGATKQMPRNKKKPGDDLLSHHEGSTIGVGELNFRVRNGNGCGLSTIITGQMFTTLLKK